MLIFQNNRSRTFPQETNTNSNNDNNTNINSNEDFNFKEALYRNCRVSRLIIHDYLKQSTLNISSWYTISLKLVTEFGLPAQTTLPKQILPVSCKLLVLNNSSDDDIPYYTTPSSRDLRIEYRSYEENDSWRTFDDNMTFFRDNIVTLQYRIIAINPKIPKNIFIRFQSMIPNDGNNNTPPLELCLGPFQLSNKKHKQQSPLAMWDTTNRNTVNLYRILPLPKDNAYSLFQELWDNGTSGKLWDSALIMNQVFSMLIHYDKNCLSGLRIMDLSAGIGCVGLSIDLTCRMCKTEDPPEIVLTDLEEALPLMKCNQRLNHITNSSRLSFKRLRWGSKKDIDKVSLNIPLSQKPFDYILVLDVLYNARDFPALITTFCQLLDKNENAKIIMGYKPRGLKQSEENMFFNECMLHLTIEQLNLESLCKEFIGSLPPLNINQSTILENTAVNFYRITKKRD